MTDLVGIRYMVLKPGCEILIYSHTIVLDSPPNTQDNHIEKRIYIEIKIYNQSHRNKDL